MTALLDIIIIELSQVTNNFGVLFFDVVNNTDIDISDVMELANLVITWSGFAIAFVTILFGIIAFLGIKEIKDLYKIRNKIQGTEKEVKDSLNKTKEYEKKLEEDSKDLLYGIHYYSQGVDYYRDGEYRDSIRYLDRSLKYIPENVDAICLKGRAYGFVNEKDKGYECFQEAIKIDSNCAAAYRGLASWYRFDDLPKALENARKATELSPDETELLNYYALLLRDNGSTSESLRILQKSYDIEDKPDTNFIISELFLAEDSKGRASEHISKAVKEYNDEEKYGISKPVWKELAKWLEIIINDLSRQRYNNALKQLNVVKQHINSDRDKDVVWGHIIFVLNPTKKEKYIEKCKGIIYG